MVTSAVCDLPYERNSYPLAPNIAVFLDLSTVIPAKLVPAKAGAGIHCSNSFTPPTESDLSDCD
jgi:hypothetical protein